MSTSNQTYKARHPSPFLQKDKHQEQNSDSKIRIYYDEYMRDGSILNYFCIIAYQYYYNGLRNSLAIIFPVDKIREKESAGSGVGKMNSVACMDEGDRQI